MKLRSTTVLPHSRHAEAYEHKAAELVTTNVPLLTRTSRGAEHRSGDSEDASETGLTREVLAFHGTWESNIDSILEQGFRPGTAGLFGAAVYTSCHAGYSHSYVYPTTSKRHTMIGCRVLTYEGEIRGDMHAVKHPVRVLPVCLLKYKYKSS
jgi:hypothetical protein